MAFGSKHISQGRNNNCYRDQKFYPLCRYLYIIQHAQCQGDGVPERESGYQDKDFFPVLNNITQTQGCYEQDVIITRKVCNMFSAEIKIKAEILHKFYNRSLSTEFL